MGSCGQLWAAISSCGNVELYVDILDQFAAMGSYGQLGECLVICRYMTLRARGSYGQPWEAVGIYGQLLECLVICRYINFRTRDSYGQLWAAMGSCGNV